MFCLTIDEALALLSQPVRAGCPCSVLRVAGPNLLAESSAGALGIVEGSVRRLERLDDGDQLQTGEVLVTPLTNIGWTPLFPCLAAIVTDLGAPLSHTAIVAREPGIPAVGGCKDATMRLRTGDRVRVNGEQGTVEILYKDEPVLENELSCIP